MMKSKRNDTRFIFDDPKMAMFLKRRTEYDQIEFFFEIQIKQVFLLLIEDPRSRGNYGKRTGTYFYWEKKGKL